MLRPATFSTPEPPHHIDDLETREYIASLRRRIEVQNDLMEELAKEVLKYKTEVEKLSLDLGIKEGDGGPQWQEVKP